VVPFVLGTIGKRVLVKEFARTVKAIETRNDGPSPVDLGLQERRLCGRSELRGRRAGDHLAVRTPGRLNDWRVE
jgi:hypothetical protein